jgi:hypothetical protein
MMDADPRHEHAPRHVLRLLDLAPCIRIPGGDAADRAERLGCDVLRNLAERVLVTVRFT